MVDSSAPPTNHEKHGGFAAAASHIASLVCLCVAMRCSVSFALLALFLVSVLVSVPVHVWA